jgi:hypothetical protein
MKCPSRKWSNLTLSAEGALAGCSHLTIGAAAYLIDYRLTRGMQMKDLAVLADQHRSRAQEMRLIAAGIWDTVERASLIEFIGDYERLARAVNAKDLGVTLPSRTKPD